MSFRFKTSDKAHSKCFQHRGISDSSLASDSEKSSGEVDVARSEKEGPPKHGNELPNKSSVDRLVEKPFDTLPLITSKVDKKDEMFKDQTGSDAELLESDDEFPDEFFVVGSELCILTADDWEPIDPAEYNSSSESIVKGDHLALVKDSSHEDGISDGQKPVTSPDQHLDINLSQKDHSPQTSCEKPGVEASPNNEDHPTSLMEAKCRERCSQTGDGCPVAPLDDCHTGSDENLVALSNDSHADDIAGHVAPAADYQGTGTPICHEKDSPSRENDVSESTDAQMLHDVVEVTNTQEADGSVDVPLITSKVDKKDEMLKDQRGSDAELLKSDDEYPDEFFVVGSEFGNITCILTADDCELIDPGDDNSSSESAGSEDKGDHFALVKDSNHDDAISGGQRPVTSSDQHLDINVSQKDHSPQTSCEQPGVKASPNNKDHPTSLMEAKCRERCSKTGGGCPVAPPGDRHADSDQNLIAWSCDSQVDGCKCVVVSCGDGDGDGHGDCDDDGDGVGDGDGHGDGDGIVVTRSGHSKADNGGNVVVLSGGSHGDGSGSVLARSCNNKADGDESVVVSGSSHGDGAGSEVVTPVESQAGSGESVVASSGDSETGSGGSVVASSGDSKTDIDANVVALSVGREVGDNGRHTALPSDGTEEIPVLEVEMEQNDLRPDTTISKTTDQVQTRNEDQSLSLNKETCRECDSQIDDGNLVDLLEDQNDKMTGSVQHKECELGEPTGELEDEAINKLGNKASEAPPRDKDLSSCSTCRDGSDGRVIASLCEHLPGQEGSPIAELSNQCDVHSVEGGNRESSTNSNDETITNFTQPKSWKQDCLPPKNVVILSSKGQRESNEITRETEHSVGELSGKNTTGIGSSATTGDAYEYTSTMEIENRPVENLFGICAFDDLPKTGCNSGVHEDTQPEDRQVHAPVDCGNIKEQGNDGFTNEFVLVTNPDGQTKSLISTKDLHPNDLDQVDDDDDFPDEFFLFSVPNNENKSLIPTEYLHPEDIVSYGSEDGEDVFSEGQFPNPLCNPIDFDGVRVERREEIWLDSQYDGGDNEDGIQLPENLADHEFISGSENTSQEYAWGKIMKSVHNYGKGSLFLIGAFVLPCVIAAKVLK